MILPTLLLALAQGGDLKAAVTEASALAERGNFEAAVAKLEDAGAFQSKDVQALTQLGIYSLRWAESQVAAGSIRGLEINDAFLRAAEPLEKAVQMDGASIDAFENLSEALLNGGDKRNAQRFADQTVEKFGSDPRAFMQRGRVFVASANDSTDAKKKRDFFARAIDDYRSASKADRKNAASCIKLGETLILAEYAEEKPDAAKARKAAAKAWGDALKRDRAAVDLSVMCQWLHSEAVPLLDSVDESKGKDATMAWYKGYAVYLGGAANWDDTRLHFEKALELEPTMYNCHYFLADGAFQRGVMVQNEGDEARADNAYVYSALHWGKYLETQGDVHRNGVLATADGGAAAIAQLKWLAGKAMLRRGFEPAIQINKWITKTTPADVEAWNNLAFLYRDTGQAEKSLAAYAKTAELAPEDPQVLNDWAVIYHYYLKTEDEKAKDLYRKAIELAEEILADGVGLSEDDRGRIQIGLRDAKNNLRKLEAGNRRNG